MPLVHFCEADSVPFLQSLLMFFVWVQADGKIDSFHVLFFTQNTVFFTFISSSVEHIIIFAIYELLYLYM